MFLRSLQDELNHHCTEECFTQLGLRKEGNEMTVVSEQYPKGYDGKDRRKALLNAVGEPLDKMQVEVNRSLQIWPALPMKAKCRKVIHDLLDDNGQDIAEYAVMLAVILVIVVGTVKLVGSNAGNVFSNVASSIQ